MLRGLMPALQLFIDGSVNPKSKVGYGAYLAVLLEAPYSEAFKADIKIKKFEQTSSSKLEIQTLIWALTSIQKPPAKLLCILIPKALSSFRQGVVDLKKMIICQRRIIQLKTVRCIRNSTIYQINWIVNLKKL